jgi:hypothetical protein
MTDTLAEAALHMELIAHVFKQIFFKHAFYWTEVGQYDETSNRADSTHGQLFQES